MGEPSPAVNAEVGILDVLRVDLCARALLDLVPVVDLVRSERVCTRWQAAVHHYLRGSSSLGFERSYAFDRFSKRQDYFRTIVRDCSLRSALLASEILRKWGPYIKKVTIDLYRKRDLGILLSIASNCRNLKHFQIGFYMTKNTVPPSFYKIVNFNSLKHIILIRFPCKSKSRSSDLVLAKLFQGKNYESISIYYIQDLTGSFLKSMRPNNLKKLILWHCHSLTISGLLSAVNNLRSLTCLQLEENKSPMLKNVGLLLQEMPQLKVLRLTYFITREPLSEESIEAFSGLVHLKRLSLRGIGIGVDDILLKALARGCPELEYLEIHEPRNRVTLRGVAALCGRSPSAVTTLDFSIYNINKDDEVEPTTIFNHFKDVPLYQELAALGYLELTLEWFQAAARDPRGRRLALSSGSGGSAPRDGYPGPGGSAPRDGYPGPGGTAPRDGDFHKELRFLIC